MLITSSTSLMGSADARADTQPLYARYNFLGGWASFRSGTDCLSPSYIRPHAISYMRPHIRPGTDCMSPKPLGSPDSSAKLYKLFGIGDTRRPTNQGVTRLARANSQQRFVDEYRLMPFIWPADAGGASHHSPSGGYSLYTK